MVDRWGEAFRLTQVSKIKDFANHLFGASLEMWVFWSPFLLSQLIFHMKQRARVGGVIPNIYRGTTTIDFRLICSGYLCHYSHDFS